MRAGIELDLCPPPTGAELELDAAEAADLPALPPGWRWAGAYAIANEHRDHVAKLLVHGEAGYLAWHCTGPGQGYRGGDLGEFLPGCWPRAKGAIDALAHARRAVEARSMSP